MRAFFVALTTVANKRKLPGMPTMNVNLSNDLAQFVSEQTAEGSYANQSEVVRDALRLLRLRNAQNESVLASLKRSSADVEAGRIKPFTPALLKAVVKRRARRTKKPA